MNECLLTLIATPELEERLVDWLLESGHLGFTTALARGHGVHPARLSAAEQVAGRQARIVFWVQVPEDDARRIVARLGEALGDAGLHYWIVPMLAAGTISAADA